MAGMGTVKPIFKSGDVHSVDCDWCHGSGGEKCESGVEVCDKCRGTGRMVCTVTMHCTCELCLVCSAFVPADGSAHEIYYSLSDAIAGTTGRAGQLFEHDKYGSPVRRATNI
jgi:hypothetical protein